MRENGPMPRAVRFGYKVSAEQFGPGELLAFTVAAEQFGFDTAAISDHFQPWRHTGGHAPFSLSWLGAAGQATTRIQLGTSVLTPSFRYHPGGRGAGVRHPRVPLSRAHLARRRHRRIAERGAARALEWPDTKERFARLKEAVVADPDALDRASASPSTAPSIGPATPPSTTGPETPIPIYIAAAGPAAARLAGRVADGLICTSGKGMELYSDTLLPALLEGARGAGRDPADLDLAIEMKVSFDTDAQRAQEDTKHWAALALSPEEKTGVEDPIEMERLADALSADRAASRWIVSTDPDEHVERIRPYLDLGFTHLIFHAPGTDQRRFLELYARDVLPRLRRLTG